MGQRLPAVKSISAHDPGFLGFFEISCPHIKSLSITSPGPHLTPEILLRFLQTYPLLSELYISSGELITHEILNHLAGRDNLKNLSLNYLIDIDAIGALKASSPFQALRYLDISVTPTALPALVGMIKYAQAIDLSLGKPEDTDTVVDSVALQHISTLIELRRLSLFVWGGMIINNQDMASLARLLHLQRLSIIRASAPRFRDADFKSLFQNLNSLEDLTFDVACPKITTDSLVALGKCCPSLRRCDIMGIYDMSAFRNEKRPVFPTLEVLSVGAFTKEERLLAFR